MVGGGMAYYANMSEEDKMVTRNVVLTDHMSQLVDGLVASGRYQNASEAMRAGLHLLERQEAEFASLRERLHAGLEQVRNRQFAEGTPEEVIGRAFAKAKAKVGM